MGSLFVAAVDGLPTALKIFVIRKSYNTIKTKKTPSYQAGSLIFNDSSSTYLLGLDGYYSLISQHDFILIVEF